MNDMILGDIIRVEDASTYAAKIPPEARKERIGRFVKIQIDNGIIVGVIKNIMHTIREELIPYIEPEMQPKYAPFNEDFRHSYYIIQGIGTIEHGVVRYEIYSPPDVKDTVELLDRKELRQFHTLNGKPSIAYFHSIRDSLDRSILLHMTEQVEIQYPECSEMLRLVRKYIRRI